MPVAPLYFRNLQEGFLLCDHVVEEFAASKSGNVLLASLMQSDLVPVWNLLLATLTHSIVVPVFFRFSTEVASSCATSVFRNVLLADSMQSDLVVVRNVCDHTPCIANLLASSFGSASVRPVSLPVLVQTLTHVLSQFVRRCKVMRGAEKGRGRQRHETKVIDIKRGSLYVTCTRRED